ncbi:ABC transporter ATP-binding protein [Bradyrhizobium erythrophlei]|jgi:putative spermidine/putrescine transport system ATP-binding protein|uniref:Spermidine/putrescine import ATP-binding protein PotA n=1 Tax=Bradyrhizobium erythrophlei TaxID=1437360 RepID=A0A1M5MNZ3_9BRAD|nr:ABC transporter ATP-binding protein [Bradyrhizobium erythrophlei]SHG78991.1 putative spermidine/putrescine transport system ATP-binding protein [Bradyrhizobium erythrophlei]
MTEKIRFDSVSKSFGSTRVVNDLSLRIQAGEFVSLLGPSGSGKTTLLMMLAGFEPVTTGSILLDGERIDHLPPYKRGLGVVFQNYALFPHMTVASNVAFPLDMRSLSKSEISARVRRALDMVQLSAMADRKPNQLSGGQQQRVALARALVFEPGVVLMDEPLGALDKQLREQMQLDIRALHRRLGLTIVFVTHDQSEALTMSDRIAVFNRGSIEQIAPPREIYEFPQTTFVADFIGETNMLRGIVKSRSEGKASVQLAGGISIVVDCIPAVGADQTVLVSLRPERIKLGSRTLPTGAANQVSCRIADVVYQGDHLRYELEIGGMRLIAKGAPNDYEAVENALAVASFAPSDCWLILK